MNQTELAKELLKAARDFPDYFPFESNKIVEALKEEAPGIESVRTILEFMEAHPDIDFGVPGALVHYIETFPRREYEPELRASIARRPTGHTLLLVNRLINVTRDVTARNEWVEVLRQVESNPEAETEAVDRAADFLEYQAKASS